MSTVAGGRWSAESSRYMYEVDVWLEMGMTGDEGQIEGSTRMDENLPVVSLVRLHICCIAA